MKTICRFILIFTIILSLTVIFVSCADVLQYESKNTQPSAADSQDTSEPPEDGFVFDPTEYPPTEGSDSPDAIELFGVCVDGKYYNSLAIPDTSITFNGYDSNGEYLWSSEGLRGFPMRENKNFPKGCPVVLAKSVEDVEIIGDYKEFAFIDKETDKWYYDSYPEAPGLYWLTINDGKRYNPQSDPNFVPPETYPATIVTQYQYVFLIVITG